VNRIGYIASVKATTPFTQIRPSLTRELMDDAGCSVRDLRGNLRDLERMNRLLGGHAIVRRYLDRVLPLWRERGRAASDAFTVLDVGTGGADVPAAIVAWGRRRRVPVRIVAVDRHPAVVHLASTASAVHSSVAVVRADARALPFRNASFDVCLCSLALHHLTRDQGGALLRHLHGLARVGFLVVDLLRCPSGYGGVWLVTRFSRNPLTRHDGPLSVRRAMSWPEYRDFARDARVPGMRLTRLPLFRVALSRIG
jgi:SAM-dependent methyltransferase